MKHPVTQPLGLRYGVFFCVLAAYGGVIGRIRRGGPAWPPRKDPSSGPPREGFFRAPLMPPPEGEVAFAKQMTVGGWRPFILPIQSPA